MLHDKTCNGGRQVIFLRAQSTPADVEHRQDGLVRALADPAGRDSLELLPQYRGTLWASSAFSDSQELTPKNVFTVWSDAGN